MQYVGTLCALATAAAVARQNSWAFIVVVHGVVGLQLQLLQFVLFSCHSGHRDLAIYTHAGKGFGSAELSRLPLCPSRAMGTRKLFRAMVICFLTYRNFVLS
jgi:hypothetical protein